MNTLDRIVRFVEDHGFVTRVTSNGVEIDIPFVNVFTDVHGTDTVIVRTFSEAREALGY